MVNIMKYLNKIQVGDTIKDRRIIYTVLSISQERIKLDHMSYINTSDFPKLKPNPDGDSDTIIVYL